MALLTLPTELHLEVAGHYTNRGLKRLVETHALLYKRLQGELHKRALSWRPKTSNCNDLNKPLEHGGPPDTPLGWAIRENHIHLVQYLLRHRESGMEEEGEWSELKWAIDNRPAEVINKLLKYAIDLGVEGKPHADQMTRHLDRYLDIVPRKYRAERSNCKHPKPCECKWAVNDSQLQVIEYLLQLGARTIRSDSDNAGDDVSTPLPFTFKARNGRILKALIDAGAEVYFRVPSPNNSEGDDTTKTTVLWKACVDPSFSPVVVLDLLKLGADPNCKFNLHGQKSTPLFTLLSVIDPVKAECLLDYGLDVTVKDRNGELPLHKVAKLDRTSASLTGVFQKLLILTPSLEIRDDYGQTALQIAISWNSQRFARMLIEAGADVTICDSTGKGLIDLPEARRVYFASESSESIQLDRINFLTSYGMKLQKIDLIATEEANSAAQSHYLQRNLYRPVSLFGASQYPGFEDYWKALLNIKDALDRFPSRGGVKGQKFRERLDSDWYGEKNVECEMRKMRDQTGERSAQNGLEAINWSPQQWDAERQSMWWIKDE